MSEQNTTSDAAREPLCKFCCGPAGFTRAYKPRPRVFCSMTCKAEWQRTQKPVDKGWLYQRYVVEKLGTYEIAKLVNRNPKQVWHWLKGYGIPVRERTWDSRPLADVEKKPYRTASYLTSEYFLLGRSAQSIAAEWGISSETIYRCLALHNIPRRGKKEAAAVRTNTCRAGRANGMYGRKGPLHPNWKGGCTPDRQAFYETSEWKKVKRAVRKRDKDVCRRCGASKCGDVRMVIHHLVSFAVVALRADVTNLVLLCEQCHLWVHSRKNVAKEFILQGGTGGEA